ncbi:MAG: hypothetical protein HUU18_02935 [Phycisphaerales bacterium]|nr:hypothetical protein [Phycisphaerales bacterium]
MDPQAGNTADTRQHPGADAPGGPDVMRVLAEFELGLESLKTLYAQRQALQAEVEERLGKVEAREAELREQEAGLVRAREELDATRQQIEKSRTEVSEDKADFEEEADKRLAEIERKRAENEARSRELGAQAEALASQLEDLSRRESGLSAQRESMLDEAKTLDQVRSQLAAREAELVRRDGQIRQLQEELARVREAAQASAQRGQESGSREQALAGEVMRLRGEVGALNETLSAGQARAETIEAALREREAEAERLRDEVRALREAGTTNDTAELERVIEALRDRLKGEIHSREDLRHRLETADSELAAMTQRCAQAEAERAHAPTQGEMPARTPLWVENRKARLMRYRAAIADRSRKLRKAGEALTKRYEQCEQVLAMRADLYTARERIVEAEKRLSGRRAGTHAGAIVLSAVASVAIIATLSWAISRHVVPATFEASSVIAADGRGRELNDAELEEWQRFHEQLLKDPVFHSAASERFQRQGVEEYAQPAGVARLVSRSLRTESGVPGTLNLRLAAPGAPRAERDLEILTAALASQANAAQQRRIDGGVTKVEQSAKAGDQPIDNTQNLWALCMAGVGTVAAGLLGLVVWRRLSRVKSEFEADTHVTRTLDPARVANFKKTG